MLKWKWNTTERLHFHFSLSCTGGGNGNPLQCSCLENPRDWGAWWAAVYGVAQSRTRLKRLSSSSSRNAQACSLFSLSSLVSGKKIKKTHSSFFLSFFFSFSLQQIPPSFYFLQINGERERGVVLVVWLKTNPQFCSVWQSPAVKPRGPSISYFKFFLRDMNPKKSLLRWWGTDGNLL